jgi:hypothetical protein
MRSQQGASVDAICRETGFTPEELRRGLEFDPDDEDEDDE